MMKHFPRPSFKYVYIFVLFITLKSLVSKLGNNAQLGFMESITGGYNVGVARGIMWILFFVWSLYVFCVYMCLEEFEEKKGVFAVLKRPNSPVIENIEWLLRICLVAFVTTKLWEPDTYQSALLAEAVISLSLGVWSLIIWKSYDIKIMRDVFPLLILISLISFLLGWLASNPSSEKDWGLAILLAVCITIFLSAYLIGELTKWFKTNKSLI